MGRATRVVQLVLAVELVAFTVSVLPGVRSHEGFVPLLDGWLQGAAYVTAAILCTLRPLTVAAERRMWTWLAAALWTRALGFVVNLSWVRELDPIPYPYYDDAGWLAFDALVLVALVSLAR